MEPLELPEPQIDPTSFVASSAQLHGHISVGSNAVIMFGVVIRAELDVIRIGSRTNIQDNSVLHCDEDIPCLIGDNATVGHAAVVHGATVGDHCLVGIGSRVLNNSVLGEGSWIAAGSVLPEGKSIPPWTLAMGIPAKPIRELTADEIDRQADGVETYQRLAATYRAMRG